MALMTSHELLAAMSPKLATQILEDTFAEDKPLYKVTLQAVAVARKCRPVFLERQPRSQRHTAMAVTLSRPAQKLVADNLVRGWLLKKQNPMLVDFLDALKIPHEKGVVENVPPTVDDALLKGAVETLLAKHPPEAVAVYLHSFSSMEGVQWPNLDELLLTDARLKLRPQA
jgi:hypothetical protein